MTWYDFLTKLVIGFLLVIAFCPDIITKYAHIEVACYDNNRKNTAVGSNTAIESNIEKKSFTGYEKYSFASAEKSGAADTESSKAGELNFLDYFLLFILCFIVGLVFSTIVNWLTSPFRNNEWLILKAYNECDYAYRQDFAPTKTYYLDLYYEIIKRGSLGAVPIVEAMEAFVRQLIFVCIIYCPFVLHWIIDKYFNDVRCESLSDFYNGFSILQAALFFAMVLFFCLVKKSDYTSKDGKMPVIFYSCGILYEIIIIITISALFIIHNNVQPYTTLLLIMVFICFLLPFVWYKLQMKIHSLIWEWLPSLKDDVDRGFSRRHPSLRISVKN